MGYNVKSVREGFKKNGIFYTPHPLAEYMRSFLPTDITEVYDPSCGRKIYFLVGGYRNQESNDDAMGRGAAQGTTTTEAIGTSGVLNLCAPAFEPTVCLGINFFNG